MIHNSAPAALGRASNMGTLRAPGNTGSRLTMDPAKITAMIEAGFDDAHVRVVSEDNTHFEALVVAHEFEGKRSIARHQLVYACLGKLVGNEIHALSIRALTPAEWRDAGGAG